MRGTFATLFILIGVVMMGVCLFSSHALVAMRANRFPDPECAIGLVAGLGSFLYGIKVGVGHDPS